jgi:DNA repair protein RadC
LVHNHPSTALHDHLVIGRGKHASFKSLGLI